MPSSPDITELWGNFKNLVKKITYDKTEVDDKLSTKANNSLVTQSSNGLMSSTDKVKLDGIAAGANKTIVDSALSTTSTNPVQNKVINSEITSLNNSLADKANANHVHSSLNPTRIPENADLNDYNTQGSFWCGMNVTAATLINCPTQKAFHLEVYQHAGVRQVLYCYFDTEVWTYERNFTGAGTNGSRWSEWHKVPTDDDIGDIQSALDKIIGV